jgi:hypothetical protein
MQDKYNRLKEAGKLKGTLKACREKQAERAARKVTPKKRTIHRIELGAKCGTDLRQDVCYQPEHRKKSRWGSTLPSNDLKDKTPWVQIEHQGKYSSRCPYPKLTYHICIRSCGVCTLGRLLWFYGEQSGTLFARRGWKFGHDDVGMYVCRTGETREHFRYHFTMSDVVCGVLWDSAKSHEKTQLDKARQVRLDAKIRKQQEALTAEAKRVGVFVTYQDSRQAGNCAAGTVAFCKGHDLDVRKSYPVEVVQRFATNGHTFQVQRAIDQAVKRSVEDLARGYCLLEPVVQ